MAQPSSIAASQPPDQAGDWPTYHRDPARSGLAPELPLLAKPRQLWTKEVDGIVYAEPLVAGNRVFVVTENDTAYALDAGSGSILWRQHVGDPVSRSALPCGNIDPSGMTSTPVIDARAGLLYAAGRMQPAHHELFAFDLSTGSVRFHRSVDPPGADPRYLQQRSALTLANGRLYIPFGGNFGDCGPYHGWIVAAQPDGKGDLLAWGVPTQREGAIWAPAGAAVDANGDLLIATGNAASTTQFDYGNAVIRLSAALKIKDWWAPADWAQLSRTDRDVGSVSPALLEQNQIFQTGKNGEGYLLRADHLGNIGGQAYAAHICNASFGATAYQPPILYVPCTDSLVALRFRPGAFDVAWRSPHGGLNAPIVAYGSVWLVDSSGPALLQLAPSTGELRNSIPLPRPVIAHFITPSAGGGRIFVTSGNNVLAVGQ